MSKKNCDQKSKFFESLEANNIKVKNFCAKTGKIQTLKSKNIRVEEIEADKLILNGADVGCLIGRPGVVVNNTEYDCMDCDGVPIKPDNIDQDVWDVLTCNRNGWQQSLQEDFLQGREEIRCIKLAYGCKEECPPDCPIPPDCPLTECPTFPDNCAPVPPECIPDWKTCDLSVENKLYKTYTLPFVNRVDNPCGGNNSEGFPYSGSRFVTNMSYNLDINNVTCNLATRVATVLVHFAYKTTTPPPVGPTGSCPVCPGVTGPEGLSCIIGATGVTGCSNLSTEVICGIVRVNCRQYYYTININLGESFSNVVNIPSDIVKAMIDATPLPFNPNNIIGAFQVAIFIEDGLEVSNNQGARGGGGNSNGPNFQDTGCFNGEAKITLANGEIKLAKEIKVGDELESTNGDITKVIGRFVQGKGIKQLVKINDLIISPPHRIMQKGKWIKPINYENAKLIETDIELYNFITEDSRPFIVEGIIASSIGEFCEGSHDMTKPMHKLWASDKIVELFQMHPQWPNIELANNDPFLSMLKNIDFVEEYLESFSPNAMNREENKNKIVIF